MGNPVLEVLNISKSYGGLGKFGRAPLALDNVSMQVEKGSIFGFLGPNGAGKTSLIKILIGVMRPDAGSCRIAGLESHTRAAKLRLGYLPERPYFHEFLTAAEFLRFHGRLLGLTSDEIDARTGPVLEKVGLKKVRDKQLRTFSKGMLQRTGIAQALIHNPEILILDEPMSGLDPVGRREMRDIIMEVAAQGKTIFFSTHIVHDVEVICTTVGFINQGKLKGLGSVESLLGKTVRSMEIRFSLPSGVDNKVSKRLHKARSTMDGWVLDIERSVDDLEEEVTKTIEAIFEAKGLVKAVVPRKSTLEDLFFEQRSEA